MRTNEDLAENLKYHINDVHEAVKNTHRTLCELPPVLEEIRRHAAQGRAKLEVISANSSLMAICAVVSTIALCKLAWWS